METVILIIHVIIAIALVALVLLQQGKGGRYRCILWEWCLSDCFW